MDALRNFKGITRKSALGELLTILGDTAYDDAGVLVIDGIKIVVSSDGIVEDIVRENPWVAGFFSVLVNVNDVVAKGAHPLGYVNVVSSSSVNIRREITRGVKYGIDKYQLKFLKGHTHPDTPFDAVDGAVVGIARNILPSTSAKVGDFLVVAIDLQGKFGTKGWVRTFDSISTKSSEVVLNRLEAMIEVAEKELAHAARDISGPGVIGTIAMLCESSRVGADITLETIPRPKDVGLTDWLMTYPAIGFVLSTDNPKECLAVLRKHGLKASTTGRILSEKTIQLTYEGSSEILMNLDEESIFGLRG